METDPEDANISSSSSDSESEVGEEVYEATGNSAEELTLQDDEKSALLQPPEDEDLGETGQEAEDGDAQYEEEGEGEGGEDLMLEQAVDFSDKKDLDKKKKKKKRKKFLYICLTNCKYDVVRRTARKFGYKEVAEDEDWSLYWTDFSVALERVMDMKKYQGRTKKINHFPGMNEICRKDLLARNLNRMMKMFPKEYNIFPKTWCLPADYGDFQAYTRQKKSKTYILKPESGCQGRGIWLTRNPRDIKPHEHMICQVYNSKPFLIDGFKFDFRIYVLVTSCDPLRIFVFKDGLARFATNKYAEPTYSNVENVYMHLTNYAINKNSEDFVRDDEAGSKRRISTVNHYLERKGVDVHKMWSDIDDTVIKTVISAHSVLKHNYRTCFPNHVKGSACFEILGFDILLDRRLRPSVIEVNHSPSFATDSQLDREIKGTLIWDALGLINFGAIDRRRCLEEERRRIKDRLLGKNTKKETKEELELAQVQYLEQLERYEKNHMGNFRRIFPVPGCEKYDKFFHSSGTLFQETAAFRARSELARQQREEILKKKEKLDLMLKKGKRTEGGLRPESPSGRRKRAAPPRNPALHLRPRLMQQTQPEERSSNEDIMDTRLPMNILEEEELERISGLLQRDNLVRGLGIVEHVYRLLHCTPGTVGVVKADLKTQPLPLVRPKDRQYYKKLLDRYFGNNHALSHDVDSSLGTGSSRFRGLESSGINRTWNAAASVSGVGNGDEGGAKVIRMPAQQFPQVRLAYTSKKSNIHTQLIHNAQQTDVATERNDMYSEAESELGAATQFWPVKSSSVGNINERFISAFQRSKLVRKPFAGTGSGGRGAVVVQESDFHSMSGLVDSDAERHRLLTGNGSVFQPSYRQLQAQALAQADPGCIASSYQCHWRSDNSTPSRAQLLSAQRQQRENDSLGVTRFIPQHSSQGLSVVSAPAPVIHRPDAASPSVPLNRQAPAVHVAGTGLEMTSTRSTKSQRIRGISNTMRLRQLELRENHAFVFS